MRGARRPPLRGAFGSPRRAARPWRGALAGLALLAAAAPAAAQRIVSAEYSGETDRYDHGILGDALEWSAIEIGTRSETGKPGGLYHGTRRNTWRIELPEDRVFEDVAPRLWDVTGDGAPEVVTVISHLQKGAALVVFGLEGGKPVEIAATPWIGRRHRWLAPVGAADLDGDGRVEIAFIDRPHLAKMLRLWRWDGGYDLQQVFVADGFTNHRIGERDIAGGVRSCGAVPEMVLATGDWSHLVVLRFTGDEILGKRIGTDTSRDAFARALACAQ